MSTAPDALTLGPCDPWIDGSDVAECCGEDCGPPTLLDSVATAASDIMFAVSGRQFPGTCITTVRPCREGCGCWGSMSSGLGPWIWTSVPYGYGATGWWWRNECGDRCGCGNLSRVKLPGYPVQEIIEVKIDGDVLDPTDVDGFPNYRLDDRRWLTRMDAATDPVDVRRWPGCQNLALDDTETGTFSVTYSWGIAPPQIGKDAAAQLACQLWKACGGADDCQLPVGVTRVVRQNVEVDRGLMFSWLDPSKPTGMVLVDAFLSTYGTKIRRRPGVYSRDVQQYAKRVG